MGGYFPLSHDFYDGLFHDPLFANEPISKLDAYKWLHVNASCTTRKVKFDKYIVEVHRGQIAASQRFLAKKWRWDDAKVERFLKKLKTEARIETQTEAGITIITLCKYEDSRVDKPDSEAEIEAQNEAVPRQYRGKDKEDKEDIKKEDITTVISPKESPPSINFLEIQWIWNEATGARVRDMTTVRQRKLRALLPKLQEHYGQDPPTSWRMYCEYIQASDVLGGRKSDWKAQLDWVLEPRNVTKILEGNYENRAITPLKPAETAYKRQSAFDAKIQGARSIIARRQQSGENKLGGI
jgi:hypothetical protein